MSTMRFCLFNETESIDPNHPLWIENLPLSPGGERPAGGDSAETFLTYGEYFSAVEAFLRSLRGSDTPFPIATPESVSVFLEKHGAFYHPSRVVVPGKEREVAYVLNLAFSDVGRQYLEKEYRTLAMLANKYGYPFLPRVFACREINVDESRSVAMFLGEWFNGYHEFHLAQANDHGSPMIRVWDPGDPDCFLCLNEAHHLYSRAAMILTACYDIQTFEQVSAWHHAAGDFVVSRGQDGKPSVKLVTVRRYGPLFAGGEDDVESMVHALALFLFNLSIRMRLDRVDGVKSMCWVDDFIVAATLDGFFEGLALQCRNGRIPQSFVDLFSAYLERMTAAEMRELFQAIGERLPEQSADTPLVRAHLEQHVEAFFKAVRARC